MKDKILNELEEISKMLNRAAIAGCKNFVIPFHQNFIQTLKNKIINFSILIKDTFPFQSKLIFNTKDDLFYGYNYINLFALGLIDSQIKYIRWAINNNQTESEWNYIHNSIKVSSKKKFIDGYHADAAFSACKEVLDRIRSIYISMTPNGDELDDAALVCHMFSPKNPKLIMYSEKNRTNENLQKGTCAIAEGFVSSVRNILGHKKMEMDKEESFQILALASLLMNRIDYSLYIIKNSSD